MKNISIYLNIVLFIAVALLYVDKFAGNNKHDEKVADNGSANSADIVYINMDSLLNGYDLYNDLQTQFMQEQRQAEANLNSKSKAYQRKAMELQDKYEKHLVTQSQAEQMQQQLGNEQQNLIQAKDQIESQLMEKRQNLNKQIFDKIYEYLEKYNKTKKYKLILGNTMRSNILEGDKNLDITIPILKGLNEEYQTNGKTEGKTPVDEKK
jgi:outer membrane protein